MSLTLTIILLLTLVVFITHALEAITGFGCTVLAFPFMIAITGDIGYSKIVLSILAWALALYFVVTKFRHIHWRQFLIIFVMAAVGVPIGLWIFDQGEADILRKAFGLFIVLTAGVQLYRLVKPKKREGAGEKFNPVSYAYLFLGGIVHGAFATGGPLIVLYSAKKITDKGQFRTTMCLLWALLNTLLIVQYLRKGALTDDIGVSLLWLLPALVVGIVAGEYIHNKVNELLFRKLVFAMLFAVGLVMIIM